MTEEQKGAITREVEVLLKSHPKSEMLKDFRQGLHFLSQLLPNDELSLALLLSRKDGELFSKAWKEIEEGELTCPYGERASIYKQRLDKWFITHGENILFQKEGLGRPALAEGLVDAFCFNNAVALVYELYLCTDLETEVPDEVRRNSLRRAYGRLKRYRFLKEKDRELFETHLRAIEERVPATDVQVELHAEGARGRPTI